MKKIISYLLIVSFIFMGCASHETIRTTHEYNDEGFMTSESVFKGKTKALFAKTNDTTQNLDEEISPDGAYKTKIGQAAASMDSTDALAILTTIETLIEALERAYQAKLNSEVVEVPETPASPVTVDSIVGINP